MKACVLIYGQMGLYEEAVELALKVDLELAKLNADKPEEDETLRKKLWLRIARHVVEEKKDIKKCVMLVYQLTPLRAMELLNQCPLLKIEDILPFFPDFTRIDDFKVREYNRSPQLCIARDMCLIGRLQSPHRRIENRNGRSDEQCRFDTYGYQRTTEQVQHCELQSEVFCV